MRALISYVLALMLVCACGAASPTGSEKVAPALNMRVEPDDFVVRRCPDVKLGVPCLIVQAGGKVLLIGAPEGAMSALEQVGAAVPDGVFIQTLDPASLNGLPALRNDSWIAGRTRKLPVSGPEGINALAAGLDAAYARSDAIVYLRDRPPGAFESALIDPQAVTPGQSAQVFDTGDLRVDAVAAQSSELTLFVRYRGSVLKIAPCDAPASDFPGLVIAAVVDCAAQREPAAWPEPGGITFLPRQDGR